MRARTRWLTVGSLAALLVAGCGATSGPVTSPDSGAKAGGKPGPIAITVADSQPAGKPSNLPLAEFKRQVESLSGGTMTVTIVTGAVDDVTPGSDALVIDKLKAGTFQMAVVPARAWSAAGVTSLKALQAPFLFESDEHVAAVVNDPAITKDLFSGLDGSGVTGLTLFPESLRHLFSFGEPMLTPADVKGKTIRAISSLETIGDHRGPRRHRGRPGRATPTSRASTPARSTAPTAASRSRRESDSHARRPPPATSPSTPRS